MTLSLGTRKRERGGDGLHDSFDFKFYPTRKKITVVRSIYRERVNDTEKAIIQ